MNIFFMLILVARLTERFATTEGAFEWFFAGVSHQMSKKWMGTCKKFGAGIIFADKYVGEPDS